MASTNMRATRVKPAHSSLIRLEVRRRERISPSFVRVTLGGRDTDRLTPMGWDQWFRLFLPLADPAMLDKMPDAVTMSSYLRYRTMSKATRPVIRNYTVRELRTDGPDGAELDVDFVVHGSPDAGTSGPAAQWALTCAAGDVVGLIDEGTMVSSAWAAATVLLVADESALPAAAGILASLPPDTVGSAILEVPGAEDRLDLPNPAGLPVTWVVRDGHGIPGAAALEAATAVRTPDDGPVAAWAAGEQGLATGMRRHWVSAGIPKSAICFCGYWRFGKSATS